MTHLTSIVVDRQERGNPYGLRLTLDGWQGTDIVDTRTTMVDDGWLLYTIRQVPEGTVGIVSIETVKIATLRAAGERYQAHQARMAQMWADLEAEGIAPRI